MLFQMSESTARKLTYQNKQLETEQLLNQTFSPENIWSESHQNFGTIWFCQLRNLVYYLHACYAIFYQKVWATRFRSLIKQMDFYQSWLCVEINALHNGAMAHTCYKFMKVLSVEFLWHVYFSWKQYFHALISNLMTATWLLRF